jgi:hypothetical protein
VFSNPEKILHWILLQSLKSKSSFFLCMSAHLLNAHLEEYLLTKHPAVLSSLVHPMHLLNALLPDLSESLVILNLFELTTEFYFCALLALAQCPPDRASIELTAEFLYALPCTGSMPTWQSFTKLLRDSIYNCVSPYPCLLRCSTTSKVFLDLMISAYVPT